MVDAVHECKFHLRVIHSHRLHTMWRSKIFFIYMWYCNAKIWVGEII